MNFDKRDLLVYAITDEKRRSSKEWEKLLTPIFEADIRILQLRQKHTSHEEFVSSAMELAEICHRFGAKFIVNDDAGTCIEVGADGVHLGQDDMPIAEARKLLGDEYIIGATAHNLDEAEKAEADGADYVGVGAAFGSNSKLDARPIELADYRKISDKITIPMVAIGGINLENIDLLSGSGADGVAVISALFANDDIRASADVLMAKSRSLFGN